ncbi:MAG TPA: hypothetical protein VIV12_16810 [Streptosporangiaceae bacterium]
MPSRWADANAEDQPLCTGKPEPRTPGPVLGGLLALAAERGGQPPATATLSPVSSRRGPDV